MPKSKAAILKEQQAFALEKIMEARNVYATIRDYDGWSDSMDDDDDEDEDEIDRIIRKSDSVGVTQTGEMVDTTEIKLLALQIMKKNLLKLLEE